MKKNNYTLERIWIDDVVAIKFVYLCQINDDEKDKSTYHPVNNQIIEYDEEKFQRFLSVFQDVLKKNSVYYTLKKDDDILGFIQLHSYNPRNKSGEIGFYFPKENRRKGYGKVLMEMFIKTVFSSDYFWEINKIYGETCETNIGSKKLFEYFGFNLDGRMREHYWFGDSKYDQLMFSILRSDYLD